MSEGWKTNTIMAIYNAMDTLGRYITNWTATSYTTMVVITFVRVVFVLAFPIAIILEHSPTANVNFIF